MINSLFFYLPQRYEERDSARYLYLMESHGHRIYLAKLTAGHCDLQGCIEVD